MGVRQDCERITRVCRSNGVLVCTDNARRAWRAYSNGLSAEWMILPGEDDRLFSEMKEYLPGGQFYAGLRTCVDCRGDAALPGMAYCLDCTKRTLDWMRQAIHRANHDGPLDECKKNTCDAALKAMGRR